jgi:hypothetical protein
MQQEHAAVVRHDKWLACSSHGVEGSFLASVLCFLRISLISDRLNEIRLQIHTWNEFGE